MKTIVKDLMLLAQEECKSIVEGIGYLISSIYDDAIKEGLIDDYHISIGIYEYGYQLVIFPFYGHNKSNTKKSIYSRFSLCVRPYVYPKGNLRYGKIDFEFEIDLNNETVFYYQEIKDDDDYRINLKEVYNIINKNIIK